MRLGYLHMHPTLHQPMSQPTTFHLPDHFHMFMVSICVPKNLNWRLARGMLRTCMSGVRTALYSRTIVEDCKLPSIYNRIANIEINLDTKNHDRSNNLATTGEIHGDLES